MEPVRHPWTESRATVAVPGASLLVVGVGPDGARPLLVAHGGPGEAHDVLRPHFDRLASVQRQVVYWDQRGGGASALDEGAPFGAWGDHVADLEAVRRHLAAERFDVLGFSWGALLALLYALEHPGRVGRLVLVSHPALTSAGLGPAPVEAAMPAFGGDAGTLHARFQARVASALFDPAHVLALTPVEAHEDVADAVWRSLGRYDLRPRLSSLRDVPTLIVLGAQDPLGAVDAADGMGATRLTVARCGHAPFVEAPSVFFGCVRGFLDAG